ncbi:MAG: hypothetical protein HQM14_16235 [SAR324 cluster bacterium]|nr:hypothetical protein [SAR324 cluster bacterium]
MAKSYHHSSAFQKGEQHPFLGCEIAETSGYSESTANLIEEKIRRIVIKPETKAFTVLAGKRQILNQIAEGHLKHETHYKDEV